MKPPRVLPRAPKIAAFEEQQRVWDRLKDKPAADERELQLEGIPGPVKAYAVPR